ncbi:MAG: PHP domain-containing protein [Candidatus Thermoplasmatota archaeon]
MNQCKGYQHASEDWMKADLHVHTSFSKDCTVSPREVVRQAQRQGLRALAITDHNTAQGALQVVRAEGIIVVPGLELSTREGHLVLLGVRESLAQGLSAAEACDRARAQGAVVIVPHPYRLFSGVGEEIARAINVHAVEGLNGRSLRRDNMRAISLARHISKPYVGGSDAHTLGEIGNAWTFLPHCSSVEDVLRAIMKGQCEPGGRHASMGRALSRGMSSLARYLGRGLKRV